MSQVSIGDLQRLNDVLAGQFIDDVDIRGGTISGVTFSGISGIVTSVNVSGGTTGLTASGGPITSTGTITFGGTLNIANGGTGQTTANAALNALLPSQTSNSGKALISNGTNTSWSNTLTGTGSATLANASTQPALFTGGGAPTAGNLYGLAIQKSGTEELFLGINKNTTTGEVPANSLYLSTYTSTGRWAIGRGNGAGLINTADILNDASGNVLINRNLAVTGTVTGSNLSGTNTGDQTNIAGNAGTATALQTGRTIAITGDLTYTSPTFNGTSNVTAAGTLATVNANVGSFTNANITVNAKGLITAASSGSPGAFANLFTSAELSIGANGSNTATAHGLSGVPKSVYVVIRNKTAELGYSVGDEIRFTGDRGDNYGWQFYANATNVNIIVGNSGIQIWNTSGSITAINTANWRFVIYAAL